MAPEEKKEETIVGVATQPVPEPKREEKKETKVETKVEVEKPKESVLTPPPADEVAPLLPLFLTHLGETSTTIGSSKNSRNEKSRTRT